MLRRNLKEEDGEAAVIPTVQTVGKLALLKPFPPNEADGSYLQTHRHEMET